MKFAPRTVFVSSAAAMVLLGGCGVSNPSYDDLFAEVNALETRATDLFIAESWSDPATLPTNGSATYEGVIAVASHLETLAALGELELVADFSGATDIFGSAVNFIDENNEALTGRLTIANGSIDRLADPEFDFTFGADMTGTLRDASGSYVVDGGLLGDFLGDDHDMVLGTTFGDVTTPAGDEFLFGVFFAEQ